MDFKREEYDDMKRALSNAVTTFAIMSEPDKREDERTQAIRKRLRELTDKLFDIQEEFLQYMDKEGVL